MLYNFYAIVSHKLLIAGDLFDRGREAVELQSFILDLLERDEVILIRGNHEDLFEELVTVDNGLRYDHHLSNGTYSMALQLTGFDKRHAKISPLAFARAARETPYYTTILPTMIDYYETDSFVFTHGWIPCVKDEDGSLSYMDGWREASEQSWRQARWINGIERPPLFEHFYRKTGVILCLSPLYIRVSRICPFTSVWGKMPKCKRKFFAL